MDIPEGPLAKVAAVSSWAPGVFATVALAAGAGQAGRIALSSTSGVDGRGAQPSKLGRIW